MKDTRRRGSDKSLSHGGWELFKTGVSGKWWDLESHVAKT